MERLSLHLRKGPSVDITNSYHSLIRKWVPSQPAIHIDDSDVIKPDGYKLEGLGTVRGLSPHKGNRKNITIMHICSQ